MNPIKQQLASEAYFYNSDEGDQELVRITQETFNKVCTVVPDVIKEELKHVATCYVSDDGHGNPMIILPLYMFHKVERALNDTEQQLTKKDE